MGLTPEGLAWLAGLIEGEGSFSFTEPCASSAARFFRFRISVTMADRDVVERAQEVSGMGRVYGPYVRTEKWSPMWRWGVDRRDDVRELATVLLPLMGARRQGQVRALLNADARAPRRPPATHGSRHTYKMGCRCGPCRAEHARVARVRRARKRELVL